MTYLDYLEQKVLLERLVIGLEEPVLIKGLGELSAKIDSGNGGYNVIHGTDFHQQGNELMFTTHDSFGHEKKIQAKVIDTIEVNMGGGNIESRPVIELDIKFAGEDYKKIPFSVSDRSSNTNPILISKGFVENELEALIDVGAMNISHEGIDVVYGESYILDEGFWSNVGKGLKTLGKTAWNGAKGIVSGIKNADTWLKGGDNVSLTAPITGGIKNAAKVAVGLGGLALSPLGIGLYALWKGAKGALEFKKSQKMASSIANGNTIVTDDYNKITKRLAGLTLQNTLVKDGEIDLSTNIIKQWAEKTIDPTKMPLSLVTSFMMTKGNIEDKKTIKGLETEKQAWKELINSAKETTKAMKDEKAANNQEQEEFNESIMIFRNAHIILNESDVVAPAAPTPAAPPEEGNNEATANTENGSKEESSKEAMEQGKEKAEELKEITTQFEQLNTFTLWFISIENDKKKKEQIENQIKKLSASLKKLEMEKQEVENSAENVSTEETPTKTTPTEETQSPDIIKDSFNPFRKKQKKEQQNTESINQKIEGLKKQLYSIGLPDKSSSENNLQKFFQEVQIDNELLPLFKSGSVDSNSVSGVVSKLAQKLQKDGKQGFFCLAWTPQSQTELKDDMKEVKREYHFFEQPEFIAYTKSSKQQEANTQEDEKTQEDEEWINSKLNFFKSKGLI